MVTISLCMIVKNEKLVLSRCLESIKDIVDEIIIVDTGSTDNTKEIAKDYTDKIYDFKWNQNFSQARNFSFSNATKDYQMWLDADDIITAENKEKLLKLKEDLNPSVDIVTFKYNTHFDKDNNPILTSCYYKLGNIEKAILYNENASKYKPNSGAVLYNKKFFNSLK